MVDRSTPKSDQSEAEGREFALALGEDDELDGEDWDEDGDWGDEDEDEDEHQWEGLDDED